MGQDLRYGQLATELKDIPTDEPVFILRGQDRLSVETLSDYCRSLELHGIMSVRIRAKEALQQFRDWQEANPGRVNYPD